MCADKKAWALPFAAWELRLYLDTHPDDKTALEAYRQLCASMPESYACTDCSKGWNYIDSPWPWMLEANMTKQEG